jgi:hypothetical protein
MERIALASGTEALNIDPERFDWMG